MTKATKLHILSILWYFQEFIPTIILHRFCSLENAGVVSQCNCTNVKRKTSTVSALKQEKLKTALYCIIKRRQICCQLALIQNRWCTILWKNI